MLQCDIYVQRKTNRRLNKSLYKSHQLRTSIASASASFNGSHTHTHELATYNSLLFNICHISLHTVTSSVVTYIVSAIVNKNITHDNRSPNTPRHAHSMKTEYRRVFELRVSQSSFWTAETWSEPSLDVWPSHLTVTISLWNATVIECRINTNNTYMYMPTWFSRRFTETITIKFSF